MRWLLLETLARPLAQRPVTNDAASLYDYLRLKLGPATGEELHVAFLDGQHRLIVCERIAQGGLDYVDLTPRVVLHRALDLCVSGLILVHNHPSGDPRPSAADIEATRQLAHGARALGIRLLDHVIVTRTATYSMAAHGRL